MSAFSSTSIHKTYKEETYTLYGLMRTGALNVQPTLITANGASKGFTKVALVQTAPASRYEWTIDPTFRVTNILGAYAETERDIAASYGSVLVALTIQNITPWVAGVGTKITFRESTASGGSSQLVPDTLLRVCVTFTTSKTP